MGVLNVLDTEILELLRSRGYYIDDGHFLLASQNHSDSYVHVRVALMDEEIASALATEMAEKVQARGCRVLAAASIGGLLLADRVGQLCDVPVLVGRQLAGEAAWVNADAFTPDDLAHVLLLDDVLTTGSTLRPAVSGLHRLGSTLRAIGVVVDRSDGSVVVKNVDDTPVPILSLLPIPLQQWPESSCPVCAAREKPLVNLSNPDEDYLSVVLSMPTAEGMITAGYRQAYSLQHADEQVETLEALRLLVPTFMAGLPKWRVGEDSGLIQFVRGVAGFTQDEGRRRVLIELVGHLLALTNIRVESRSLGCAVVVGDPRQLDAFFGSDSLLRPPPSESALTTWRALVPYFDALVETENVFVFDSKGSIVGIKRLARVAESRYTTGTQLLREITSQTDAVSMLVRRERKAVYVYRDGRLTNLAELSEKSGVWEFSAPGPLVADIESALPGISPVLEVVLEICREMVTRGYGGLFVIGERPKTLRHQSPKVKVVEQPLRFLGTGEAAELAKLDGAVFVRRSGDVEQASVIITNAETPDPPSSRRPGGARSQTAHRTSLECPDAAVVLVSQNGTIEVHVRGRTWPVAKAMTSVSVY